LAARTARRLKAEYLMVAVGVLIILLSLHTLLTSL
jgi:hypothetical protein